jgi:formylglycine-generating enzyme required for sulfatase activity
MFLAFRQCTLLGLGFCALASIAVLAEGKKDPPALLKAPFTEKEAKAAQEAWAKHLGRKVEEEVDLGGGVKLVLVLIPPGTFTMGSPTEEKERKADEVAHTVTITKPFCLGKYAVTQEQYEKVVGKNPSWFKADGGGKDKIKGLDTMQFPIEQVVWEDADGFCQAAGKKVSWGKLVLPSEAQWEYSCRAGTATPFHFGDENDGNRSNCDEGGFYLTVKRGPYLGRPCEVRAYTPNGFGLYQMHGNVLQWCADFYGPYEGLNKEDPVQLKKGAENRRVFRGGSWGHDVWDCRAAQRDSFVPGPGCYFNGFRVCVRLN